MLVELKTKTQARRLELDNYRRTGAKSVETTIYNFRNGIIGRDDVEVNKISLDRENSDEEKEIINNAILKFSGKVEQKYAYSYSDGELSKSTRNLMKVSENSLTVYYDYEAVLNKKYPLIMPEDELEEVKAKAKLNAQNEIEKKQERIQEYEDEIEDLEAQIDDLTGFNQEDLKTEV